ncbi:helix-turn-helix domain-containing protein [Streptosporangium canum]|uniref:helix-turn-helix domain-containing protein n=1 Tax=Streptosporangium canum TaxID=324952 RepID=UPI0034460C84
MTVTETAQLLGIHRDTAYDAVRRGDIPSILAPTAKLAALLGLPYVIPEAEAAS